MSLSLTYICHQLAQKGAGFCNVTRCRSERGLFHVSPAIRYAIQSREISKCCELLDNYVVTLVKALHTQTQGTGE